MPLPAAVVAMDLSQYVTQALWNDDGTLLQLPHFTKDLVTKCKAAGKTEVLDIAEMEVSRPTDGLTVLWCAQCLFWICLMLLDTLLCNIC